MQKLEEYIQTYGEDLGKGKEITHEVKRIVMENTNLSVEQIANIILQKPSI